MDGRPWLRILAVVLGFLALGLPVWSATAGRAGSRAVPISASRAADASLHLDIVFSQAPSSFEISTAGQIVCRGAGPERRFSAAWTGALPKEGVDFLIKAAWPGGASESATRVQVTRDDMEIADQTFWAESNLVDTVTVPGGK